MDFPKKIFKDYTQEDVAEANRRLYAQWSINYDKRVITDESHTRLRSLLSTATSILRKANYPGKKIQALDACGGTGNAAFILDELCCEVTVVDISPEMVSQFKDRCRTEGKEIPAIISDVSTFLEQTDKSWDLIVFSSALHHFRNPGLVFLAALSKLASGGLAISTADPTPNIRKNWFRFLSLIDRSLYACRTDPVGFRRLVKRRLFGGHALCPEGDFSRQPSNIGQIGEYQAQFGIDDYALKNRLTSHGYSVILHERYSGGYNRVFQSIYHSLKADTSFCLIVSNRNDLPHDLRDITSQRCT